MLCRLIHDPYLTLCVFPLLRLEAATSRLEDIAVQPWSSTAPDTAKSSGAVAAGAVGGAAAAAAGVGAASSAEVPPSVEAWDDEVGAKIAKFIELSNSIGGNVQAQVSVFDLPKMQSQH